MKRVLAALVLLVSVNTLFAQGGAEPKTISVKGKVQFLQPEKYARFNKVWMGIRNGRDFKIVDSTQVNPDGTWSMSLTTDYPRVYTVEILKEQRVNFYADEDVYIECRGADTAKIKIKNPPYVYVQGSASNNLINQAELNYWRYYQNLVAISRELYFADQSKDTTWINYLKKTEPMKANDEDFKFRQKILLQAYKNDPVVLHIIRQMNLEKEKETILPILANLEKKYPWNKEINEYRTDALERIAQANKLKPGQPAPVVAYNDLKGKPVSTASYKGKVLLIDFWASWCGPCRQAIPKVRALYDKYNKQGFDVISISIDDKADAWRKAVEEEKMPWKQVLSSDKNQTMKEFMFAGIPTLYLIDRDGKIISSYTGYSQNLETKLAEIFGNK